MIDTDFTALDWLDLNWFEWKPLDKDSLSEVPKEPGLYRVRHKNEDREHLEYIGESDDTRRRIQSLARGVYAEQMLFRDPIQQHRVSGQLETTSDQHSKCLTRLHRRLPTSSTGKESKQHSSLSTDVRRTGARQPTSVES